MGFFDDIGDVFKGAVNAVNDAVIQPVTNTIVKPVIGGVTSVIKPVVGTVASGVGTLFNAGKQVVNDQYRFIQGAQNAVIHAGEAVGQGIGNLTSMPVLLIGGGAAILVLIMLMNSKK